MARRTSTFVALLVLTSGLGVLAAPTASADHLFYNVRIRAFDNNFLDATVFVPEGATANSTPFVLMTHGWAGSRVKEPTGRVGDLLDAGYGVLTWDSRGFGNSDGEVMLNSPDFEVRDVSSILTHLARHVPQVKLQSRFDPVVGMSGGSYAGGIQLLAVAFDQRIDAIAPEITWNDLVQSLAPNGVPKLGWTTALFGAGQATSCSAGAGIAPGGLFPTTGCQTSDLARYYTEVHATNGISDEVRAELLHRSPATYMSAIDVPTLLIQGFPDTLFDVNQAVANYDGIKANGAPVKLWLYDGGHALPGTSVPNTQGSAISAEVVRWMDKHLRGLPVDTGAEVEYFANGVWESSTTWPPTDATPRATRMGGIPALFFGPVMGGGPSSAAFPVAAGPLDVAGTATLEFSASGLGAEPTIFVGLGVSTAGTVTRLGPQIQPIRYEQGTSPARYEIELVEVAGHVPAGSSLVLVFSTSEPMYNMARVPGFTNVNNMDLAWHAG